MKSVLILGLVFISTNAWCQKSKNASIEIKYVNLGINTIIAVDYKKFDSAFAKDMYKDTVIINPLFLSKLLQGYKAAKYNKRYKKIDTRYKISLHFSDIAKPVLIYMSYFDEAIVNNKLLAKCDFLKSLQHLIDSIVNNKKI
jgi:hypothetical protein